MQIHSTHTGHFNVFDRSQQGLQASAGVSNATPESSSFQPVDAATKTDAKPRGRSAEKENREGLAQQNASTKSETSPSNNPDQQVEREAKLEKQRAEAQERVEQQEIAQLSARDREVRAHEQAHVAAGGQYAGAATYQYERGPNGVNYAVAGEVSISVGQAATPEETIQKAQVVKRAALAPAEPSPQDRRVAAQAAQLEAQARQQLAEQSRAESQQQDQVRESSQAENAAKSAQKEADKQAEDQNNLVEQADKPLIDPQFVEASTIYSLIDRAVDNQATAQFLQRLAVERGYNTEPAGGVINTVA